MKKFFPGILALGLAVGAVAFTEIKESKADSFYWYKRTAANTYVVDHSPNTATPTPSTSCNGGSTICVKGFAAPQTPSSITDAMTSDKEEKKTP